MTQHQINLSDQHELAIECLAKSMNLTVPKMLESIVANVVTGIRREGRSEAEFVRYCYGEAADDARREYHRKGGE